MEPPTRQILKGLPLLGSKRSNTPDNLSAKDKRYYQQVEKALTTFDSLEEWADYISFLSRLQKALQLNEDSARSQSSIPYGSLISNKLSLCLSSRLPNGVHQKTLSIYESIFSSLTTEALNDDLSIWLPGLLPVLSYCSISVKPQLIHIFKVYLLPYIRKENLRIISKPIILSLLPGLDDENSEVFGDVIDLVDTFKLKLDDDSHFWQSMFLCIISNPEKRLGALLWCNRRLPVFSTIGEGKEDDPVSTEANACLTPEPGLLIRSFSTAISSSTSMNSASDIIVVRGFFDLLLSHLPLDCKIFNTVISSTDKELLIMACCKVTLKKDMSLNRRLWNLFLGPEPDTEVQKSLSRSKYFENYALESLSTKLLEFVHSSSSSKVIEAFKISLSLIMDKWEISTLLTPKLFSPLLEICYESRNNAEILASAQAFFDGIESSYIWNDIILIIVENDEKRLHVLEFVLRSFNFNEEEMITIHAPLAALCLLSNASTNEINSKIISILELLISLIPQRAFGLINKDTTISLPPLEIVNKIKTFYDDIKIKNVEFPIPNDGLSFLTLDLLSNLIIKYLNDVPISYRLISILCDILNIIPKKDSYVWLNKDLLDAFLNISIPTELIQSNDGKILLSFGVSRLFNLISRSMKNLEKEKLLKIILSNLWVSLYSSSPANYQVESVKAIYDLELSISHYSVEAGLIELLLQLPIYLKVRAFETLWTHSNSLSEGDRILIRPLQILLDALTVEDDPNSQPVISFIGSSVKNGSANRLLKLITDPLLSFGFIQAERVELVADDDLNQFSYFLITVLNVLKSNGKHMKETFNNEFAVMDNSSKLNLIQQNDWEISTYKTLILSIIEKFFELKLDPGLLEDESALEVYYNCVETGLKLMELLITGSESFFVGKFHSLVNICFYYMNIETDKMYIIELLETKLLKSIFHYLELADDLKINLNLLLIEDDETEPLFVRFIIQGIEKTKTSLLLESWVSLLTRSLHLFHDSVFSVLLSLNDAIIKKVEGYFKRISQFEEIGILEDIESSINILVSGLEDFLSISHSFLVRSALGASQERTTLTTSDSGFLNTVIQGVFSIESPALRTTAYNRRYSVILSFQDATKICFQIWSWSDSKPRSPKDSFKLAERSLTSLGHKLKFRARKLLEALMDLERREVIETIVEFSTSEVPVVKLLHILDGGRSQITLPHIFDSIISRCYPQLLDEQRRSSLSTTITDKELSKFLVSYFHSIDIDAISDIWVSSFQFFKDILSHPSHFRPIFPDCLKVCAILSNKLNVSKLRDQRKYKKELADVFSRLLNSTVSSKTGFSNSEAEEVEDEEAKELTPSSDGVLVIQDDILDAISVVLEQLDSILQDSDKVVPVVNILITYLITPQIRPKKLGEISLKTLTLLELIGKYHPIKAWKNAVFDAFMDVNFFSFSSNKPKLWNSIISLWISSDKERIGDMILRITPTASSTAGNIFTWNENSEIESKIGTLKRVTYLISIQPKDYFLEHFDEIFNRIEYALSMSCPAAYRAAIATLLRALSLKFSELHLLPRWTIISQELISIFELLLTRTPKELNSIPNDELKLLLNGCKLLDQLLILGYDEFNLQEWLFISNSPDVINGKALSLLVSIIDRISKSYDLTYLKDVPVKIEQPNGPLVPLLNGVKDITSVTRLRLFFDSLSLIHYERTFGLYDVDVAKCNDDVLNDLI
ncbi:Dopey, N-terminal-domain-containing protein [Scheffersomyces coipomensis]|uniref:Dopey, N-terminal-domain-containing protein n=1 Tax=Scheffersomyces coipomensis TaxID=1788519 RepID=UPI00315D394A